MPINACTCFSKKLPFYLISGKTDIKKGYANFCVTYIFVVAAFFLLIKMPSAINTIVKLTVIASVQ